MWLYPKFPIKISDGVLPCEYCGIHDNITISEKDFREHKVDKENIELAKIGRIVAIHRDNKLLDGADYPYDSIDTIHFRVYDYWLDDHPIDIYDKYCVDGYVFISAIYGFKEAQETDDEIMQELKEARLRQIGSTIEEKKGDEKMWVKEGDEDTSMEEAFKKERDEEEEDVFADYKDEDSASGEEKK